MNAARPVAATRQTCQCCGVIPIWGGIGRRVQIRQGIPNWGSDSPEGPARIAQDAISALDGSRGRNASTFIRLAASRGSP